MTRLALGLLLVLALALPVLAEGPPQEHGTFREPDLVELTRVDPTLRLDLRYATADNFMKRVLYPEARAFLQRPVAEALGKVNRDLRARGYGLSVLDAYRPWSVTKKMWDEATPEWRRIGYVADPARGSRHNRGATVDVSVYDLSTGKYLPMPSRYDEFTERAHADSRAGTAEQRRNRDMLIAAMKRQGFRVLDVEWWHFDHQDWEEYPLMNLEFSQIPTR